MTDMRNVNNWHWVNKDCRSWAKTYITQQLVGLSVEKNKVTAKITSLDECTGDVDLNQRKGKLLAIYDVALKLSWEGQLSDGNKVFGNISVPEVAYDTDMEDYVFVINVNSSNDKDDQVKKLIRTELTPLLCKKFSNFTRDLIENYSYDLYANNTPSSSAPPTPDLVQRKTKLPPLEKKQGDTVVKTTIVEHSFEFKGEDYSARDIYEALLDPKRADIWTHGKSQVSKKIGSQFKFFDGNVHGELIQATPSKSIIQTWRLKNWPKDHYSTVSLELKESQEGVTVKVNQVGVPVGQEETIRRNWMGYYWKSIKDDYHQLQRVPYSGDPLLGGVLDGNYMIALVVALVTLLISFTAYTVAPTLKFPH